MMMAAQQVHWLELTPSLSRHRRNSKMQVVPSRWPAEKVVLGRRLVLQAVLSQRPVV